ncbi:MAG: hypothetical protein FJ167_09415 [Gammaproteobacteria bacterium]|nr:hypothetical protein [Gammaproteobacteria bacterium]
MSETRHLVCEGTCNPGLAQLDEQRRQACRSWSPERSQMPSMHPDWLDAMRQLVHTVHCREAPGFMSNIWTCAVCGATRRW